jgi:hypothetical protein
MTDRGNGADRTKVSTCESDAGTPVIVVGVWPRAAAWWMAACLQERIAAGRRALGRCRRVQRWLRVQVSAPWQRRRATQRAAAAAEARRWERSRPRGTSGLKNSEPHLHFEIRTSDWQEDRQPWARKKGDKLGDYGPPMDPLKLLPPGLVRPRSAVAQVQDKEQQRPERVATSAPILPGKPDPLREQSAVVLSALSPADAARAFVGHREVKTAGPSGLVGGLLLIAAVWKTLRRRARA